eukprot:SAG22_NODE_48_length_24654_cov_4.406394_15_plen_184_part_00
MYMYATTSNCANYEDRSQDLDQFCPQFCCPTFFFVALACRRGVGRPHRRRRLCGARGDAAPCRLDERRQRGACAVEYRGCVGLRRRRGRRLHRLLINAAAEGRQSIVLGWVGVEGLTKNTLKTKTKLSLSTFKFSIQFIHVHTIIHLSQPARSTVTSPTTALWLSCWYSVCPICRVLISPPTT